MGRHRLGRGSPQRATRHPGDGLPPFSYEPSISTPTLLLGLDSVGVAESIAGYTGVIACREIMSRRLLAPRAAKGLWASNIGLVLLSLPCDGGSPRVQFRRGERILVKGPAQPEAGKGFSISPIGRLHSMARPHPHPVSHPS